MWDISKGFEAILIHFQKSGGFLFKNKRLLKDIFKEKGGFFKLIR
jgi:hypothetical protein